MGSGIDQKLKNKSMHDVTQLTSFIMSQCARPCCNEYATKRCSACLKEGYCSSECQNADWKKHKKICKFLKRLSNNLQPYHEVEQVIEEILDTPGNARVLDHLLKYTEFQFGNRIHGQTYRQRGNSGRKDNFEVEIYYMLQIYQRLVDFFIINEMMLSMRDLDDFLFPYYEKMLEVLKPWSLCVDLNASNQVESLSRDQIDVILKQLSVTEQRLGECYRHRNEFDTSENYFQRALLCETMQRGRRVKNYLIAEGFDKLL
jgi:tetratricopeptide (TPR) repeat protein